MSTEAENVLENVSAKEHKGQYGNTKGKSPNALYKSYKTYMEDNKKQPMPFPKWMEWAQKQGVVKGNYSNADALTEENKEDKDITPKVKSNVKKYASVAFVIVAAIVLYKAFKADEKK